MTDSFDRAFQILVNPQVEGVFSADPEDPGNWTGGKKGSGVLGGTKYGISAARYPGEDISGLTLERAKFLYKRDYWDPHGCDKMEWAKALYVFDTSVNGGLVHEWWMKTWHLATQDFLVAWTAERMMFWSKSGIWPHEYHGWVKRALLIYEEAKRSDVK